MVFLGALISFAAHFPAAAGPLEHSPDFKKTLAGTGLEYDGTRSLRIDKNFRRGDWKSARTAFWTLTASDGTARLRLELTKNISRAQAERTMDERFLRIDALYSGGAAYPGMITTEFEVPKALRPVDVKAGPDGNRAKMLAATPTMAYGAGAEDLVSHRGVMGYIYCEKASLLAQIELFFPKAEFLPADALKEFDRIVCAAAPVPDPSGAGKPEQGVRKRTDRQGPLLH
jgi:hypothetical protein